MKAIANCESETIGLPIFLSDSRDAISLNITDMKFIRKCNFVFIKGGGWKAMLDSIRPEEAVD
jgi:hypothetical protein